MTKKIIILVFLLSVAVGLGIFWFNNHPSSVNMPDDNDPTLAIKKEVKETHMQLSSSAFDNQSAIPAQYTCDGENIHPPLTVANIPQTVESLALIVDDPDAPAGDWVHWLMWNIDPHTSNIPAGEVPDGTTQGLNDFNNNSYGGPCPPSGQHRYQFKLYALDTTLELSDQTNKAQLLDAMHGHILDQTKLVGSYQRQS